MKDNQQPFSSELSDFLDDLKEFRTAIRKLKTKTVGKRVLCSQAASLARSWFNSMSGRLAAYSEIEPNNLERYNDYFRRLLKISGPSNLRSSYMEVLNSACQQFRDEIIIPVQTATVSEEEGNSWLAFCDSLPDIVEKDYLGEAVACARNGHFRAAAVMGWCACIDQIHRKIEAVGFAKFNVTSSMLSNTSVGRFKRFNKVLNINSVSELRMVFDTDILWILEGLQLIDSNQHQRLRSCFDMRCQAAHPGEAPITEYNLMSFFSDIVEIVLKNPTFSISSQSAA